MKPAMGIGVLLLGIVSTALGACENSTKDHVTSPSSDLGNAPRPAIGGGPRLMRQVTGAEAMSIIADARCDQEVRCNRIGPGSKYVTRNQCVTALEKDKGSDFTERSCPDGVSELGLESCLQAIREEGCGGRSIKRENACLAEKFCSPPAAGTGSGGPGASSSGK